MLNNFLQRSCVLPASPTHPVGLPSSLFARIYKLYKQQIQYLCKQKRQQLILFSIVVIKNLVVNYLKVELELLNKEPFDRFCKQKKHGGKHKACAFVGQINISLV